MRWMLIVFLAAGVGLSFAAGVGAADRPPNVVVILMDDLGATDLGCYGSRFYETPAIDRLAAQGMRFTAAYSACTVCSPTRAALLTGRYPARLRLTDWIPGEQRRRERLRVPDWTQRLVREEITLAEALAPAGYVSACVGKWHLGGADHTPLDQGFAENYGGYDRGQPPSYFAPYKIPTLIDGPAGEYLTDREAAEATRFVERHRDRPFFLYWPMYAVHTPLQAKRDLVAKFQAKADAAAAKTPAAKSPAPQANATYAAMIASVDEAVGRLVAKLDELKLAERTIILFTSDNGGLVLRNVTSNAPLRSGKGSPYEGGVRVPAIVRWPGVVRAGSTSATPVITPDYFPTLLAAAGVRPAAGVPLDGVDLAPLWKATGALARDAIYWHYPHYHVGGATPYSAMRAGRHKLIEFFPDERLELYDLEADPGETTNLATTHPDRARQLHAQLRDWRRTMQAQLPAPNPDFRPSKP